MTMVPTTRARNRIRMDSMRELSPATALVAHQPVGYIRAGRSGSRYQQHHAGPAPDRQLRPDPAAPLPNHPQPDLDPVQNARHTPGLRGQQAPGEQEKQDRRPRHDGQHQPNPKGQHRDHEPQDAAQPVRPPAPQARCAGRFVAVFKTPARAPAGQSVPALHE